MQNLDPSAHGCPPTGVWYSVAVGTIRPSESQQLLTHASVCSACFQLLSEAQQDLLSPLEAKEIDQIQRLTPNVTADLAARLASQQASTLHSNKPSLNVSNLRVKFSTLVRGMAIMPASRKLTWAVGLVAVIVLVGFIASVTHGHRDRDLDRIVARAYQESRYVPVRFDGIPYAKMQEKSRPPVDAAVGGLSESPALVEARTYLAASKADSDSVAMLQARARIDILEGNFQDASSLLQKALLIDPESASVLTDLASSYLGLSSDESAGQQVEDCDRALGYINRAYQVDSHDAVLLFNRAVVLEGCNDLRAAGDAWQDFLKVEPDGPWAQEAQTHKDEILAGWGKDRLGKPLDPNPNGPAELRGTQNAGPK